METSVFHHVIGGLNMVDSCWLCKSKLKEKRYGWLCPRCGKVRKYKQPHRLGGPRLTWTQIKPLKIWEEKQ